MAPFVKELYQMVCSNLPRLRGYFQPKRYILPVLSSDLYPPSGVGLASDLTEFINAVNKCAEYENGTSANIDRLNSGLNVLIAQEKWSDSGCPTYYLGADIGEALVDTEPPADFLIEDVKFPFPAMRIWIPRHWFPLLEDHLCYIDLCLVKKEDEATINEGLASEVARLSVAPEFPQGDIQSDRQTDMLVVTAVVNEAHPTTIRFSFPWESGSIGSLLAESRERRDTSGDDPSEWYGTNMLPFIINLLLVLGGVPDEVGEERCVKPAKIRPNGQVKRDAIWEPAFIGRPTFKPLDSLQSGGETEPSERKLPSHVRRGHWKRQVHGQGRTQRKLIWVHLYRTGRPEEE